MVRFKLKEKRNYITLDKNIVMTALISINDYYKVLIFAELPNAEYKRGQTS